MPRHDPTTPATPFEQGQLHSILQLSAFDNPYRMAVAGRGNHANHQEFNAGMMYEINDRSAFSTERLIASRRALAQDRRPHRK
jgi:hypothetical protein